MNLTKEPIMVEPVNDRKAIESSCKFIEQHIATRKCDSPAVSECWRCNSAYLAKRMRELLNTFEVQGRAQPAGEVVVTKNDKGQIVAVTRQNEEGQVLSIISESEPQPVAVQEAIAWIEHHKGGDNLNWERVDHPYAPATPLYSQPATAVPPEPICSHGIHLDNACGACIPPRGTTNRPTQQAAPKADLSVSKEWLAEKLEQTDDTHAAAGQAPCKTHPGCNANNCLGCGQQANGAPVAVDPLQYAVNWLNQAIVDFNVTDVQTRLFVGYNRAKRLFDAARAAQGKDGGA